MTPHGRFKHKIKEITSNTNSAAVLTRWTSSPPSESTRQSSRTCPRVRSLCWYLLTRRPAALQPSISRQFTNSTVTTWTRIRLKFRKLRWYHAPSSSSSSSTSSIKASSQVSQRWTSWMWTTRLPSTLVWMISARCSIKSSSLINSTYRQQYWTWPNNTEEAKKNIKVSKKHKMKKRNLSSSNLLYYLSSKISLDFN